MEFDIDLGKVAVTLAGEWENKEYEKLTIVTHGGESWISRQKNDGVEPGTNARVWQLVASKGEKGDKGDKGEDGQGSGGDGGSVIPGTSDVIGVAYDETDGKLYWTKNGEWLLDPDGNKIAVSGVSPNTSFKSIVFKRSNSSVDTPTGGSYESPVPSGWSDGVPTGSEKLWMSTRIFSSDGESPQQSAWTTPAVVTDTEYMDYEFSSAENPGTPAKTSPSSAETNPYWSDTADTTTLFMAMREVKNGAYAPDSSWKVIRIKGEKGEDGTSVTIKGTLTSSLDLPDSGNTVGDGYIIDGDLWVWDGDSWVNAGAIQGPAGTDGQTPHLHIKYSDDGGLTFTANGGETPGDYIGIYWDFNVADSSSVSSYTWQKWKGEDGFGYEYIFKLTADGTAPNVPATSTNVDDYVPDGWTDDPGDVSVDYPYCWVCYRKKTEGVWGSWVGSGTNSGKAALFSHFGKDGANGVSPNTSFKSIVFKRSNSSVDTPTGGSYESPVPSGWSDGVPAGEAKLWMSTRIFSSDGEDPQQAVWSTPVVVADNEYMDYEFSSAENPGTPSKSSPAGAESNPNWSNTADTTTIFMAMREVANGAYAPGSSWKVLRVKGEKGEDGTSVTILGTLEDSSDLPLSDNTAGDAYIIDGNLWVWDGDSWVNAGAIQGPAGADGQSPHLHIKYSDDGGAHFTANNGETPGNYLGIYWDYNVADSLNVASYTWHRWRGEDGFGYEYIFKLTADGTAPNVPATSVQQDDAIPTGWTDDPGDVSADYPYCWVCYRKKTDGVWGQWKGSATNSGKAGLFSHFGKDGVGTAGRGISNIQEKYAVSSDAINSPQEWQNNPPALSAENKYLWNYEIITFTDETSITTRPAVIGTYGEGRGITSITEHYLISAASSGITRNNNNWSTSVQYPTVQKPFLWNYEETLYSDGTREYSEPIMIGHYGADGSNGQDGVGIRTVKEFFLISANPTGVTTNTSGWSTTPMAPTEAKPYLWNYESIQYTDNTQSSTQPHVIGHFGTDGAPGRGISSITNYYLASSLTSVSRSTQGWTTSPQTIGPNKLYLWNYEEIAYSDGSTSYTSPVIIGIYGVSDQQSDTSFLEEVFGEDHVSGEEGALLRNLIGVTGASDKVVAMMNASDIGEDNTHGRLFFAAGMNGVATQAGINAAKFKVYEDGYIEAASGKIGPFVMDSESFRNTFSRNGSVIAECEITLLGATWTSYIGAHSSSVARLSLSGSGITVENGADNKVFELVSNNYAGLAGLRCSLPATFNGDVVFNGNVSGLSGNIVRGISVLTSNGESENIDPDCHTYVNRAYSSASYTLPLSPSAGEEYEIVTAGCRLIAQGSARIFTFINGSTSNSGATYVDLTGGYRYKVIYDGSNWLVSRS